MANIKRTKLVLRFNIGTEDAPKYKDVTYTRVAEEAFLLILVLGDPNTFYC
ncbi:MAG: hypothetical protein E6951_04815 [Veillonella parvula]|nr:hypothetical protein [Veillonella parvula]